MASRLSKIRQFSRIENIINGKYQKWKYINIKKKVKVKCLLQICKIDSSIARGLLGKSLTPDIKPKCPPPSVSYRVHVAFPCIALQQPFHPHARLVSAVEFSLCQWGTFL